MISLSPVSAATPASPRQHQKCIFFRTVPKEDTRNPEEHRVPRLVYPEVSDSEYGINHIKAKPSLGLAMSGGGFRAATCAAGWARGLQKTLVPSGEGGADKVTALSQVKYLATTSGGSWFNAALSYTPSDVDGKTPKPQVPLDTFLGDIDQPEGFSKEALRKGFAEDSFDAQLAKPTKMDNLMWDMWDLAQRHVPGVKHIVQAKDALLAALGYSHTSAPDWASTWTKAVTQSFLEPYGLNAYDNSTVTASGTTGPIAERALDRARADAEAGSTMIACADPDRPFPIFMGSAFNPRVDDGCQIMYPYEFTPLYFGTPGAFPNSQPPLGGGYTEPWGLNAMPEGACVDGHGPNCACATGEVGVDRSGVNPHNHHSLHTVPLVQAVGISSSFLAASAHKLNDIVQEMASTEELVTWGLVPGVPGKEPEPGKEGWPEYSTVSFADGGTVDNLGISALLRRGVKCMIVCSAASAAPDDTWEQYAAEACDVACWFGAARACWTPGITFTELNDRSQVFGHNKREGEQLFRDLFDDVHAKLRAGKPGFHHARYKVYENHFHNIPARGEGEEVEVLWIFNHQFADWEARLHKDTRDHLLRDRHGQGIHHKGVMKREVLEGELKDYGGFLEQRNLSRFPYFTTFSLLFSPEAVRMLGQLSSAVVMDAEVQQHITQLVENARQA